MAKKPAHHVLDIYGAHLWLAVTPRQWAKLVDRFEGSIDEDDRDSIGATALILDSKSSTPHIVVWLDVDRFGDDALGCVETTAHEATHVATLLLTHLRHTIRSIDEPHAYLVGWVTRWMLEQIPWKK